MAILTVQEIIALFGAIVFIGFFAEMIFRKFSIPNVLLLLFLGVFIGSFSGAVAPQDLAVYASLFAPIALIIMLFEGGLNMNILEFLKETPVALIFSFLVTVFQIVIISIAGHFILGWDYLIGAILGAILSGVSSLSLTADPTKVLSEGVKNIISLESVATDVFGIVFAITLINIAVGVGTLDINSIGQTILTFLVIGTVIGGIGAFIWGAILKYGGNIDFGYVLTIGFLFILYYISDLYNGNGPITVLIFGLFLGNMNLFARFFKTESLAPNTFFIKKVHKEITFFISTFFFVYLGTIVVFNNFDNVLIGIVISVLLIVARYILVNIFFRPFKLAKKELKILSIVSARDLSTAVLAPLPLFYGIQGTESFSDIAFSVIICTVLFTVITYILITKVEKEDLAEKIEHEEQEEKKKVEEANAEVNNEK